MLSGQYGENIMIIGSFKRLLILCGLCLLIISCGEKVEQSDTSAAAPSNLTQEEQDKQTITDLIHEAVIRWSYGDKGALYDLEYDYIQDQYTFDEYLELRQIKYVNADTVLYINVLNIKLFGRDSAIARIEVLFQGPSGKISKDYDNYPLYFHHGRWLRPTVGITVLQDDYDELIRQADSAAAAEAEEG
jgi:hypothetical protein